MKLKTFAIILLSWSSMASLDVNVFATKNLYKSTEQVEKGMLFLKEALKNSCSINLKYNLNPISETKDLKASFKSDSYHKSYKTKYGKEKFIYFQKGLYEYLLSNNLLKINKGINIHFVNSVQGHCGFAFPTIQLEKIKSNSLKKSLRNNILMSLSSQGCGNKSRLFSHEMAHLLVQDSPAHMCHGKKCSENNILSVFRVKPKPPVHFGGNSNFGDNMGMGHIPYQQELIPSIGRSFNKEQCAQVKSFLKKFSK